jgi:hypothetical protein
VNAEEAEHAAPDQWYWRPDLERQARGQHDNREGKDRDDSRLPPSRVRSPGDADDKSRHPRCEEERASQVRLPPAGSELRGQGCTADGQAEPGAHRDVDEQRPPPAQFGGEDSAEHAPDCRSGGGGGRPQRHRRAARSRPAYRRRDQAKARWCQHGGTNSLDRARRKEHGRVHGQPAGQAARGEQRQPRLPAGPVTKQVIKSRAQQQQATEREQIHRDYPVLLAKREPKISAHGRQRQIRDGHVEHDHELPSARQRGNDARANGQRDTSRNHLCRSHRLRTPAALQRAVDDQWPMRRERARPGISRHSPAR